ncbi:MAG: hypothetical protein HWD59_05360 [Coxiellaceae bacterium]|nr:MAG: hypothetical protein HWD59_05360 [Coxiellaceae bacterium]
MDLYAFIDYIMALPQRIGIEKGIRQGIEQGLLQGQRTTLLRQLHQKFKIVPIAYQKQIEAAPAEKLLQWTDAIIEAKSLEELFVSLV